VIGTDSIDRAACAQKLAARLLERRAAPDHWDGHLSSSALSTATAVLALAITDRERASAAFDRYVHAGIRWLIATQNPDGGWGDTVRSRSNISTTVIVWAMLTLAAGADHDSAGALARAEAWLRSAAGHTSPAALREAILKRYGADQTFSVPILTVLALTGRLGSPAADAWRSIPQLPFELAALPHEWFQHLRLRVVSYALPALIAIGQVRHGAAPSRNPLTRALRNRVRARTLRLLREMQPESGGYLEATPLTSFVVMSLSAAGHATGPVVEAGTRFLTESMRDDGSWPIDTNLSTWVTTLSINALAGAGALPPDDRAAMREWLLRQQTTREHPFTHAAPGAWAWTPLSGGVPDADDTSGALVALRALGDPDPRSIAAAAAAARWLLGVQNQDGGMPTFCRGWGALPFDRSAPEITAHALRGLSAWAPDFERRLHQQVRTGALRALRYLETTQRPDGSWRPLWFGSEHTATEDNPVYGTARVLLGLAAALVRDQPHAQACVKRGARFLLEAQNRDGGWGGDRNAPSSIEETAVVLSALRQSGASPALEAATRWLTHAIEATSAAAPIGLYFARLWYYEELYPLIFALDALGRQPRESVT
jgi:squalene-hopene/tetraprenyl-beta-curcumene cyclase